MNEFENRGFLRRNAIPLVVVAALVIFGILLVKGWGGIVNNEVDGMITVTGNFSCLPLTSGAIITPEDCELGVRSRDGLHYALDVSRIQDANSDLKAEDTIAVTGFMKSPAEIPSSNWSEYTIAGIIQVNTLLRTR